MADCSLYLRYNIVHEDEILKTEEFSIDADYLVSQYLNCSDNSDNQDELDDALANASESNLIEMAQAIWCSGYVYNILMEETFDYIDEISQSIADSLNHTDAEDYSAEGVADSIEWVISKAELIINGKTYVGK